MIFAFFGAKSSQNAGFSSFFPIPSQPFHAKSSFYQAKSHVFTTSLPFPEQNYPASENPNQLIIGLNVICAGLLLTCWLTGAGC